MTRAARPATAGPEETGAVQSISAVALVAHDYDEAIHYFARRLRFAVVKDTALSPGKRWVIVRPPGGGTAILLAKAANPEQALALDTWR